MDENASLLWPDSGVTVVDSFTGDAGQAAETLKPVVDALIESGVVGILSGFDGGKP